MQLPTRSCVSPADRTRRHELFTCPLAFHEFWVLISRIPLCLIYLICPGSLCVPWIFANLLQQTWDTDISTYPGEELNFRGNHDTSVVMLPSLLINDYLWRFKECVEGVCFSLVQFDKENLSLRDVFGQFHDSQAGAWVLMWNHFDGCGAHGQLYCVCREMDSPFRALLRGFRLWTLAGQTLTLSSSFFSYFSSATLWLFLMLFCHGHILTWGQH